MNIKERIHFPGLNGIRAIAALAVVISHTFQSQAGFRLPLSEALPVGSYAVTMFFTLSGFLITYLLLVEKNEFKSINIFSFYIRRMLRIWPLYFGYIILVCLCFIFIFHKSLKNIDYLFLYIIFLPNIAFNLQLYPPDMAHLWTIGIEEQFYVFWPQVVSKIKNLKKFSIIFIVIILIIKTLTKILSVYYENKFLFSLVVCMRFDCMAIGALFAVHFYEGKFKYINKLIFKLTPILFWFVFLFTFLYSLSVFSIYVDEVVSVLTGMFIITQITNKKPFTILENNVSNFLGKISFGIYVYHPLVMSMLNFIIIKKLKLTFHNSLELIIIEILCTVLIAYISYRYYESFFLKLKNKFAFVKT